MWGRWLTGGSVAYNGRQFNFGNGVAVIASAGGGDMIVFAARVEAGYESGVFVT